MDYQYVTDIHHIKKYLAGAMEIAFDFETAPAKNHRQIPFAALDPHRSEIVGISLSVKPASAIYIPLRHQRGKNANIPAVMKLLKERLFENSSVVKIAHNLSFETMFLYKEGIVPKAPLYDTIAAAQLTLKAEKEFRSLSDSGLKTLVPELLGVDLPAFADVTQGRHFDELNPEEGAALHYACADSDYAFQLYHLFNDWFRRYLPRHEEVVRNLESPTAVFVGMMKHNGIAVDTLLMYQKQLAAEEKLTELRDTINAIAGRELNIGANASTADFKKFLYEEQKLPVLKTTVKFKEAADDEALILLKSYCKKEKPEMVPFLEAVQEYRKWSKLKSTYIDGILAFVNSVTSRVHPDFFSLGTETGRFASRKPNAQNWPRKDNDPIGIRNFFCAKDGHVLLDFDFSQIELRVGAYYCRDARMLDTYKSGGDIHAQTTAVIYNIPFQEAMDKNAAHYKERRSIAKNCNFGVFYGLFPKGLQRNLQFKAGLDTTLTECEEIIRNLKAGYPELTRWQNETKKRAGFQEYSETAFGRRRYLKGINSRDWGVKSYWERCALNTPIQGTAADILKRAMAIMVAGLSTRPYIKPLVTIHDEIVFEVPVDKVDEATAFIKACMEQRILAEFDVPIVAEGAVGLRFGELEELA
ncbi:MAG: bifunctional 3'-5' exonuclease/DNA polymerase [Clostridium sp.]|nr:bifunctional 3'-5' exonuclease/DNA polymerase [Clostridium sp.]